MDQMNTNIKLHAALKISCARNKIISTLVIPVTAKDPCCTRYEKLLGQVELSRKPRNVWHKQWPYTYHKNKAVIMDLSLTLCLNNQKALT